VGEQCRGDAIAHAYVKLFFATFMPRIFGEIRGKWLDYAKQNSTELYWYGQD